MARPWLAGVLTAILALATPVAGAIRVSLPTVTAGPGERVRVPVQVEGLAGESIYSANLEIRLALSAVTIAATQIDARGALASGWSLIGNPRPYPENPQEQAQILVGAATGTAPITTSGIFLYLDLEIPATAAAGTSTPLRLMRATLNNGTPTATLQDGLLTIAAPQQQADFAASPLSGTAPLAVNFEDYSTEGVQSWSWDFGDGGTSAQPNPIHQYERPGTYTVSLTVTWAEGADTETKPAYILVTPDLLPPDIVEGPIALGTTHNATTIYWKTNEEATSQVQYCGLKLRPRWGSLDELGGALAEELVTHGDLSGCRQDDDQEGATAESCGEAAQRWILRGLLPHFNDEAAAQFPLLGACGEVAGEDLVLSHEVRLTGLSPFTFYVYRVRSADEDGNASAWRGGYFVTQARPDDVPPRIVVGPRATPSEHRAWIAWETDEPSNSLVQYSLGPWFTAFERVLEERLVHAHEVWLEGLAANTLYYYRVRSGDASGNLSAFKTGQFRTTAPDATPPVIWNGPRVTQRTPYTALIEWETDEPGSSRVEFGTSEEYDRHADGEALQQRHRVLLTHLDPQTLYHFRVRSADMSDNQTVSGDGTFVTRGQRDEQPPGIVRQPYVICRFHDRITLGWIADEVCQGRIEYGTTADLGQVVEVPEFQREHVVSLTGLAPGTTYHCRVSLVDLDGNGPTRTERFTVATQTARDTRAPIIEGQPVVQERTDTQVSLAWTTDEAGDSFVEYGVTPEYGHTAGSVDLVRRHQLRLTGLQPGTLYYYRVASTDAAANGPTTSAGYTFTTQPTADGRPPVILAGPAVTAVTESSAEVEWQTDEPADSFVDYGTDTAYGQEALSDGYDKVHRVRLTGLRPATQYHLQVASSDPAGNGPTVSQPLSFTTHGTSDRQGPAIRGVSLRKATAGAVLLEWWTDEPADCYVEYGTTAVYGQRLENPTFARQRVERLSGLDADREYHFRIGARDISGNQTVTADYTCRTQAEPDRLPPVVVAGPEVVVSHATATFLWRTNEPCFAAVAVGTESTLGTPAEQLFEEEEAGEEHRVTITGLDRATRYLFALVSRDLEGNETVLGSRGRRAGKVVRPLTSDGALSFVTTTESDFEAPAIVDGPRLISRTDREAILAWTTNEIGDSRVYLEQGGGLELIEFVPQHDFEHRVLLTGLEPGQAYRVRVGSADPAGNGPGQSGLLAFTTTTVPDATPPTLVQAPTAVGIATQMATIVWETDEASSSEVSFGTGELAQSVADPSLVTQHRVDLVDLAPGTAYRFQVRSRDAQENGPTESAVLSFTTAATADLQPPLLVGAPAVAQLTDRSAVIRWSTDEAADGFVQFGTSSGNFDQVFGRAELTREHEVTLALLQPATTYYLKAASADRGGNGPTESAVFALTTLSRADQTPPPAPAGLSASLAGGGQAILTWAAPTATDVAGYLVYRAAAGGVFLPIAGPLAETAYRDVALAATGEFAYRVSAVDLSGNEGTPSVAVSLAGASRSPGDFQGDGEVGFDDFFLLAERFGLSSGDSQFGVEYDLDEDGHIGFSDFFAFVDLFGTRYGAARSVAVASTPAPYRVVLGTATGDRPGEVVVTVRAADAHRLRGFGMSLAYDADRARFLGARFDGTAFDPAGDSGALHGVLEDGPGRLAVAGFLPSARALSGEGRLVELVFEPAPGKAPAEVRLEAVAGTEVDGQYSAALTGEEAWVALLPERFGLHRNWPNPFNPSTAIGFQLPVAGPVSLRVYNVLGQEVAVLVDAVLPAGFHRVTWEGRETGGGPAGTGVYLCVLEAGGFRQVNKLLLVR
ncbi:MAG: fibronectin type III domain-containing protein [Candidatus Latescibacterota bacterium]|jgi:PKD repeat protein